MILDDDKKIQEQALDKPITLSVLKNLGWTFTTDRDYVVAYHPSGMFKAKIYPADFQRTLFGTHSYYRNVDWFRLRPEIREKFFKYKSNPDAVVITFAKQDLLPWSRDIVDLYIFTVVELLELEKIITYLKEFHHIKDKTEYLIKNLCK